MIDPNQHTHNSQDENSQLQALIAALDDIVFEVDADMTFLNVWTRDESYLFMPREQFLGRKVSDVMGPLTERLTDVINTTIQTGERQSLEYRHLEPSVERYYKAVANKITALACGKPRVVLTVSDVTEATVQQQQLARIKSILEHSQKLGKSGGWAYDVVSQQVWWTENTYHIFGLSPDTEITYELATRLFIDEDNIALDSMIQAAATRGISYKKVLRTQSGKWIDVMGEPVFENGVIVALTGAIMDITDNVRKEQELTRAKEAAEAAANARTNFLSVMSHEIRTPLNGIIGIANLLGLNKNPEQEELVESLIFSANHLLRLVNDILDLNKMQGDKLTLLSDTVSLKSLTENITRQFRTIAQVKGIQLATRIDEHLPATVNADAVRLGQVLNNLVNNAVKFTDVGTVTVSVSADVKDGGKIATVRFSVADTGPGIAEEHQQKIFEPFEQLEQSSKRKHAGTGFGLQIAQKLVALMGGDLQLRSEPGHGAEFYFTLNLDILEDVHEGKPHPVEMVNYFKDEFAQLRLLLAEDNPVNTLVARKQLESFYITPTCAVNGREALQLLQTQVFDIALIDLHMPEMDGFELAALIRKDFPDVYIVVFTADITNDAKERLHNLNVYDIINKPFKPKEMYNILLKVWADKIGVD